MSVIGLWRTPGRGRAYLGGIVRGADSWRCEAMPKPPSSFFSFCVDSGFSSLPQGRPLSSRRCFASLALLISSRCCFPSQVARTSVLCPRTHDGNRRAPASPRLHRRLFLLLQAQWPPPRPAPAFRERRRKRFAATGASCPLAVVERGRNPDLLAPHAVGIVGRPARRLAGQVVDMVSVGAVEPFDILGFQTPLQTDGDRPVGNRVLQAADAGERHRGEGRKCRCTIAEPSPVILQAKPPRMWPELMMPIRVERSGLA